MSNRIKKFGLVLVYIVVIFFIGCIPKDSLEWSEDGSVGLLRIDEALYLVDGETGQLTEIAEENVVQPWPDISKDGSMIAYSREVDCDNLSEGLKLLPAGQVKMIEYNSKKMREDILEANGLINDIFPEPEEKFFSPGDYRNWIIQYMCENADNELIEAIGEENIQKGKEKSISYFQVVVVSKDNLEDRRAITSNIFGIVAIRLSPDGKYVAYIMQTTHEEEEMDYSLYVASLNSDITAIFVDERVALGYDWSKDSKNIAYIKSDTQYRGDDLTLGSLMVSTVADANSSLLCKRSEVPEQGTPQTHNFTGMSETLAGLFYYPWLKVRWGIGDRIFLSTVKLPLPTSNMDKPGYSLFCYDPVIDSVTDIMPPEAFAYTSQSMDMLQFELSPDGKIILVPMKNNRFLGFELGTDNIGLPITEEEGFGEDEIIKLVPTFKGNDEISFLVSENSHFLTEAGQDTEKKARSEIIILNKNDFSTRVLSESWPDEIMEALVD